MLIDLPHVLDLPLAAEGLHSALLQKTAHAGQTVLVELVGHVVHRLGGGQVAHPPAGHGHALGKAVHGDDPFPDGGAGGHADAMPAVDDALVHLIGEEVHLGVS